MTLFDTLRSTFGLLLVLGLVVLLAFIFKKISGQKLNGNMVARVIGGVSLGTRERLVVVEVANRWLVVGVASGRITALAELDPASDQASVRMDQSSAPVSGQTFEVETSIDISTSEKSKRFSDVMKKIIRK